MTCVTLAEMFHFEDSNEGGGKDHPRLSYPSLDAAIDAAFNASLDLDRAAIEKANIMAACVNEWIMIRIAGGHLGESRSRLVKPAVTCRVKPAVT